MCHLAHVVFHDQPIRLSNKCRNFATEKHMFMQMKTRYIFIIGILLVAYSCRQQNQQPLTTKACLEEAEAALDNDSIRLGETMLWKTIHLSEESGDWHTNYIAYQRLAEALSQGNPEEALRLMKKALSCPCVYISSYAETKQCMCRMSWCDMGMIKRRRMVSLDAQLSVKRNHSIV